MKKRTPGWGAGRGNEADLLFTSPSPAAQDLTALAVRNERRAGP
jgi:hypothetical protein